MDNPTSNPPSSSLVEKLEALLREPSREAFWELRAELFGLSIGPDSNSIKTLGRFHTYLTDLETRLTSKEYSHFASLLDMSAMGGVLLSHFSSSRDQAESARNLLGSLIGEGLMVAGTRQHVKAWEAELQSVFSTAAWELYEEIWSLSMVAQPEMSAEERKRLLKSLFECLQDPEKSQSVKSMVVGRLFQFVLVWNIAQDCRPLWEERGS